MILNNIKFLLNNIYRLINQLKPWYDEGLITIWSHEQAWLGFTDKAKHHLWVLNIFILVHIFHSIIKKNIHKSYVLLCIYV